MRSPSNAQKTQRVPELPESSPAAIWISAIISFHHRFRRRLGRSAWRRFRYDAVFHAQIESRCPRGLLLELRIIADKMPMPQSEMAIPQEQRDGVSVKRLLDFQIVGVGDIDFGDGASGIPQILHEVHHPLNAALANLKLVFSADAAQKGKREMVTGQGQNHALFVAQQGIL